MKGWLVAMSNINLEAVTAVQNMSGGEPILGHLMWFSVGKQLVKSDDLENLLDNTGIDKAFLPNPIRCADAFRRATKEVEQKKQDSLNVFKNYLVREVFSDPATVQRNIVVETVDQNGKRLDYDPNAAFIMLDKKKVHFSFSILDESTREMCHLAEEKFQVYKSHYSAQQVRVMVAKILNSLAPTPARPHGGIYFVPSAHTEGLEKLVKFVSSLENSEGFKVPLINTYDNVKMVSKRLSDHLESLISECKSSEGLRKAQLKELIHQANMVIGDYKDYRDIVRSEEASFEEKIGKLKIEVARLIENMSD